MKALKSKLRQADRGKEVDIGKMLTAWWSFPLFRAFSLRAGPSLSALCKRAEAQIQNLCHISLGSQRRLR